MQDEGDTPSKHGLVLVLIKTLELVLGRFSTGRLRTACILVWEIVRQLGRHTNGVELSSETRTSQHEWTSGFFLSFFLSLWEAV